MKRTYDDMLELPHHVSSVPPQMTMQERAAQFSPFAALTGYGDVIQHPLISVTYFLPDQRKAGGAYVTMSGRVKRIDDVKRILRFENGDSVKIADIAEIEAAD